ncbi:MAG: DNA primase catalytic subunit PriS [Halobacteriota archaeon]
MNEQTKRFVRSKFEEYYKRAGIKIPRDSWMREWGFVLLDPYYPAKLVMRRHKSFATKEDLANYLRENAPAHAYYSTAIYKYPAADMANKGWLGADLIFDLDADHVISEAEFRKYSYEDLLELVKKETVKLIDFLLDDFGFHEEDIELVFSGSRGYHIHIKTEDVRALGSRERREIVDYVMATGLDMDKFLAVDLKEKEHGDEKQGRGDLRLIPEGWGKRLLKGWIDLFHEIAEMEEEKAIEVVKKVGEMEKKKAKEIIRIAKDETVMKRIERGQIPRFFKPIREGITKTVTEAVRVKSADKPDEPVTSDIKRLIRLPTSLHGKSSLEAKPLRMETFKDFDPLKDAVVFGDSPVEISVARSSSITMKGERYKVEEGEIASVPEHVALYFMCRGAAEIKEKTS